MQKMEKADEMEETGNVKSDEVGLLLRLVVKDRNGVILSDTKHKPAKSFVIQFLEFIYGLFRGSDTMATAVDNTEKPIYEADYTYSSLFSANEGVGGGLYSVVVGTNDGESPESNMDYSLDTKIAQGSGSGQMMHGVTTIGEVGVVGANVDVEWKRVFTNLSGAQIIVKEVGMRTRYYTLYYHLAIRDVITQVAVPDNCSLTVYYTLRTTV